MQCPNCRLENPPSSSVCDCGYDFVEGIKTKPDSGIPQLKNKLVSLVIFFVIKMIVDFTANGTPAHDALIFGSTLIFIYYLWIFSKMLDVVLYQRIIMILLGFFSVIAVIPMAWVYGIYIKKEKAFNRRT